MLIKDLLAEPGRWCRGVTARTAAGLPCNSRASEATAWCLLGAILLCYDTPQQRFEAEDKLAQVVLARCGDRPWDLACYNDHPDTTHADIRMILEEAGV